MTTTRATPIGIKILKLSNSDTIIAKTFTAEDAGGQKCILVRDALNYDVYSGVLAMSPWVAMVADDYMTIYYDSIITMANPSGPMATYYENIVERKLDDYNIPDDDEAPLSEEEVDRWEEIMEAVADKKDKSIH
jgi:hypothetical protein